MRAVVLVGGLGTRLQPLTLTTPKSLLPVGHHTILEHVLHNLARGGVTDAVLSLGFKPDGFLSAYPDGVCAGVRLHYAVESEPLDTAGAIRFAAMEAGFTDDTFLALNGDVLTDLDVAALVSFHRDCRAEGTLHLIEVEDPSAFGVVSTTAEGRVEAFVEKPPRETAPTNYVNAGTYVLEASVLERIPEGRRVSIERETFPAMVADGVLYALPTNDYWLDAGRPDQLLQANLDLLDGARRETVDPIGPGVTVDPRASVARCVVGAGSQIATGAAVTRSVLLPGTTIGEDAVVRDSILGRSVSVGAGARLSDVVIGDGTQIPPGAVLHKVRVPEPR